MSVTPIRRKVLGDLVDERLRTVPGLSAEAVFRGEIPNQPPTLMDGNVLDPSGRVAKHLVWFAGYGSPIVEADVADANTELDWLFTVICVAGFEDDCIDLVDDVHNKLFRWTPVLEGHAFGRVKAPPGFDPGSVRRVDVKGIPPRFELPLLWRVTATTS